MRIDVWSDVVCPFCYLGKARLEQALAGFGHAGEVEVVYRSFELDPTAAPVSDVPMAELLAKKYGMSPAQVEANQRNLEAQAAAAGLEFHLDISKPSNTFDAHRLLHLAAARGLQTELKRRLLAAYFTEGLAVGDRTVLAQCATEVGLDAAEVARVLGSEEYADEVLADEALARELQITGVPFFVFDGRLAVSGAQPVETFTLALERAWESQEPAVAL